ncbi:MAG TPA: class E sortase [Marmoricola sp.]|nr:class E sortase [Marmoricola sp.]
MSEARTGARLTLWIGVGLILAGLGVLGWVGWQFYGTNWVSKRAQREAVTQLEQSWRGADDTDGLQPDQVELGQASALIRIPKFGKDYVVPVFEGVGDDILAKGYGHFTGPGSTFPGQRGNYALAAHRVTHGEPLREMPSLRPGDQVVVETVDKTYTYVLDTNPNDLNVDFTQTWVVEREPRNPIPRGVGPLAGKHRLITLTTCSELFHTDNRMIAFGHLESVQPKAPRT